MPKSFSFNYFPIPERDPKTGRVKDRFYPLIPIRISYEHRLGKRSFYALVDSGSDRNLFPALLGEQVGMNPKKGIKRTIQGIGDVEIKGFTHNISIYIQGEKFQTEADFSYEQEIPLLGRNGFFNLFKKIVFNEEERVLDLVVK